MRLFLAVDLASSVTSAVGAWMQRVTARLGPPHANELKLVDPGHLHLTLQFFGEVAADDQDLLRAVIAAPLQASPYDLELGWAGCFPPSGRPRILWLGLANGRDATIAVHDEIQARLDPTRFALASGTRPFLPHLTVARVTRDAHSRLGRELSATLEVEPPPPGRSRVDRVTLYQSHLSPHGSRYEAMLEIPLAGLSAARGRASASAC